MKNLLLSVLFTLTLAGAVSQTRLQEEQLADQYYRNGDLEKALLLYSKLFDENKGLQYYDAYFSLLLKLRKYPEAEKLVKGMMSSNPDSYIWKVDYGRVLQEQGATDKADKWYDSLIKELPADENIIRDLSSSFYRANAYEYSVRAFQQGRKLLKDENAFTFDLLALYRYLKSKELLTAEYLRLLDKEPNPNVVNQAKNAFEQVFETNGDFAALKTALLSRLRKKTNPALSDLLIWVCVEQKDYQQALKQAELLDKELKEDGERIYDLAGLFISTGAYANATEALQFLIGKGRENQFYIPSKIDLLKARYQMVTGGKHSDKDLKELENGYVDLLTELGRNRNTVFAMQQLAALEAWYLNQPQKAETILEEVLRIPQLQPQVRGQVKLDLGDIYILTGEVWEAALVYGQVEKELANEPQGQEAKFRNARLCYYRGDFTWAKAQLDVLKSSTSQLIANDALNLSLLIAENTSSPADTAALMKYAAADRLYFCGRNNEVTTVLDSIDSLYPQNSLSDDILMLKSKIFIKQNNTEQAILCLKAIEEKYSYDIWADDALFTLGDIYENTLHDREKAEAYYKKLISDYPGSIYAAEARKRFRNLRGDNVG